MARASLPLSPRISSPDLPARLDPAVLGARVDLLGALVEGTTGDLDATDARVSESILRDLDLGSFDFSRSRLSDVDISGLCAVVATATESRWQSVRIDGGRIATLDLSRSTLSGVEIRGARIDYLTLAGADASDLRFVDCTIGALDAPQSTLRRVAFDGCRVNEVDNRGWRTENVDLRGLEGAHYLDMAALRGTTLSERQVSWLGPAFAAAVGVDVRD